MNIDRIVSRLVGPLLLTAVAVWFLLAGLVSA